MTYKGSVQGEIKSSLFRIKQFEKTLNLGLNNSQSLFLSSNRSATSLTVTTDSKLLNLIWHLKLIVLFFLSSNRSDTRLTVTTDSRFLSLDWYLNLPFVYLATLIGV